MNPSELLEMQRNDRHLTRAASFLGSMFKVGKPFIQPKYEKRITLKMSGKKVWRMVWDITEEFFRSRNILFKTPAYRCDIEHERMYVVDVYEDGQPVDYIIEKNEKY